MNDRLRHILVPIGNPERVPAAQLRKAATLARASGATVELFHAVLAPDSMSSDPLPHDHIALKRLQRFEASPLLRGVKVRSFVAHDYPVHEAIVRRASEIHANLVIAAPELRTIGKRLLLRNTDWQLIRLCPCPLLIVRSKGDYDKPVVLTAVDPFHSHAKPVDLDQRLLNVGNAWARLLRGESHAFHAYLPLAAAVPMPSGQPMSAWLAPEIEDLHASQVMRVFQNLSDNAGISAARRHLSVGDVPTELKHTIRNTRARIVVMGAVSRSMLKRLLIGSTAERVLDDLTCDVLIVKPLSLSTQSSSQKKPQCLRAA